jgi:hypothetical protein
VHDPIVVSTALDFLVYIKWLHHRPHDSVLPKLQRLLTLRLTDFRENGKHLSARHRMLVCFVRCQFPNPQLQIVHGWDWRQTRETGSVWCLLEPCWILGGDRNQWARTSFKGNSSWQLLIWLPGDPPQWASPVGDSRDQQLRKPESAWALHLREAGDPGLCLSSYVFAWTDLEQRILLSPPPK